MNEELWISGGTFTTLGNQTVTGAGRGGNVVLNRNQSTLGLVQAEFRISGNRRRLDDVYDYAPAEAVPAKVGVGGG
jgi:hypothetical protein